MENKKMTKAQKYAFALTLGDVQANPILVEFFNAEIELLKKKNATDRKPTAQQIANDGVKEKIVALMADGTSRTVTEIMKQIPELASGSNQRATALVRQLSDQNGLVPDSPLVRTEVKGRAYFTARQ